MRAGQRRGAGALSWAAIFLVAAPLATACSSPSVGEVRQTSPETASAASSPTSGTTISPGEPGESDASSGPGTGPGTGSETSPADEADRYQGIDEGPVGAPTRNGKQSGVFAQVPGSKAVECVDVGDARDMRSGGFVAGAFDDARAQFGTKAPGRKRGQIRVYWIPLHAAKMRGLTVDVTRLETGASTTVRQQRVADADEWQFYDTFLTVDAPGRWRFEARSGNDRGCFEVDFS